jgi:hypothetical protein
LNRQGGELVAVAFWRKRDKALPLNVTYVNGSGRTIPLINLLGRGVTSYRIKRGVGVGLLTISAEAMSLAIGSSNTKTEGLSPRLLRTSFSAKAALSVQGFPLNRFLTSP